MTAYFDNLRRSVAEIQNAPDFLDQLIALEHQVIHIVNLVTGDREFPDDLRERIQGIIAIGAIQPLPWDKHRNARPEQIARRCLRSTLFEDLHSAFHSVATRRINTRFGLLFDDPASIVRQRDAHDNLCPRCSGDGEFTNGDGELYRCPQCNGTGSGK